MTFTDMLRAATEQHNNLLRVGLDPESNRFPGAWKGDATKISDFCEAIVNATADIAQSFKPQVAYFAAHRAEDQFEQLMAHMRRVAPNVPVILDAKRGDIGSTAEQYAKKAWLTAQGLISVNSSRAILYASSSADFADAAWREALKTRDVLNASQA